MSSWGGRRGIFVEDSGDFRSACCRFVGILCFCDYRGIGKGLCSLNGVSSVVFVWIPVMLRNCLAVHACFVGSDRHRLFAR